MAEPRSKPTQSIHNMIFKLRKYSDVEESCKHYRKSKEAKQIEESNYDKTAYHPQTAAPLLLTTISFRRSESTRICGVELRITWFSVLDRLVVPTRLSRPR